MPDLHGWITQQIDKVEAAAREATDGPWFADHPEPRHWGDDPESALIVRGKVLCILDNQHNGPLNADHIALHSPDNVLRRCTADRKLLAGLLAEKHTICEDSWYHCLAADDNGDRDGGQDCTCGRDERVERRVRLLAEAYGWEEQADA